MATSKVPTSRISRNPTYNHPERHRRAYEEAGQLWPENIGKHLRRAAALEAVDKEASRRAA